MAELIHGLDADTVRANLERIRGQVGDSVEILAAVKYVPVEETEALVEAGVTLAGENRQQDLAARSERFGDRLTFDFIGHLQSRKVKQVIAHVRLIHSVSTDSVLEQLGKHATPETEVLVEVNLSGEGSKGGVAPEDLDAFMERCPVTVSGLMTMPPLADDPEASRPYFARLRELAQERGLPRLSMGTSQDYAVAVEEGATVVRIGTILYR